MSIIRENLQHVLLQLLLIKEAVYFIDYTELVQVHFVNEIVWLCSRLAHHVPYEPSGFC